MPDSWEDLHGSAPDKSSVVLLLIDLINDMDFPEGEQLLRFAVPMAQRVARLKGRVRAAGVPVVYVNDNFGRWRSNFHAQVSHCLRDNTRGKPVVELLKPDDEDYFVLKPRHSGFYSTTLELLLDHFRAETVVLAGMAANICVLFTANDAYMRGYRVIVPRDCVASNSQAENDHALAQMEQVLKADTRASDEIRWEEFNK